MPTHQRHGGIDSARFIAAVFVIAIHASPFSNITHLGGTLTTLLRTTARLAVPFFLMTSGYFLFHKEANDVTRLRSFILRILGLYSVATALYFPILLYTKYFNASNLLLKILKDIIFDGTFYHLWYLPAAILGALFVSFLIKHFTPRTALIISFVLYLIGMLGDSYYGLTARIRYLNTFYQAIFVFSDFTRNGVFFAPIFILLGSLLSTRETLFAPRYCFLIFYLLMLTESLVLRIYNVQRHDCMYIFLLPASVFLFCSIVNWERPCSRNIRCMSTTMYLLHPIIIITIRFFSKLLSLQKIFIENSMIYFVCTLTLSILISYVVCIITNNLKKKGTLQQ